MDACLLEYTHTSKYRPFQNLEDWILHYIQAMIIDSDASLERVKIVISEQFTGDQAVTPETVERLYHQAKTRVDIIHTWRKK